MDGDVVVGAIAALTQPGLALDELEHAVPREPGLYAFHALPGSLDGFDWDVPVGDRPLYVGKAEASLHSRDVTTHFATGATGRSTVRRSLAAVLREQLDLTPAPRSTTEALRATMYGLTADGDARLSAWMAANLRLAWWVRPGGVDLGAVETAAIARLEPPLNLDKSPKPVRALKRARAAMAEALRRSHGGGSATRRR